MGTRRFRGGDRAQKRYFHPPLAARVVCSKIETWATHLIFLRIIFIFLSGPHAHDSSVEKRFQEGAAAPQISPLRFAPVEMTKGRAVLPGTVVAEQEPFFHHLGRAEGP
jgi:hypothetical protein